MNLSKNFTLEEMTASPTAKSNGIHEQFVPPADVVHNLRSLCETILQPFRDRWGHAVSITSGYRCPKLNKAVGGVATSAHVSGMAADISFAGLSEDETIRMVEVLISVGAKRVGLGKSFIHVDIDYKKPTPAVFMYGAKTPKWLGDKRKEFLKMIRDEGSAQK